MNGTIARTVDDRGFGFITPEDGSKDVFFHARSLVDVEFDDLKEGDKVTFDLENGPKGPAAANVARAE
ncbi:MAG: CspA family cold shock protein [Candidatus Azotimanducaceae bacterium]